MIPGPSSAVEAAIDLGPAGVALLVAIDNRRLLRRLLKSRQNRH